MELETQSRPLPYAHQGLPRRSEIGWRNDPSGGDRVRDGASLARGSDDPIRRTLAQGSGWRKSASAIPIVSVRVPCRQSVLLSIGIVRLSSRRDSPQSFGGSFDISSGQTVSTTALISSVTASRTGVSTT